MLCLVLSELYFSFHSGATVCDIWILVGILYTPIYSGLFNGVLCLLVTDWLKRLMYVGWFRTSALDSTTWYSQAARTCLGTFVVSTKATCCRNLRRPSNVGWPNWPSDVIRNLSACNLLRAPVNPCEITATVITRGIECQTAAPWRHTHVTKNVNNLLPP